MAVAHILLGFLACGATAVALGLTALRAYLAIAMVMVIVKVVMIAAH